MSALADTLGNVLTIYVTQEHIDRGDRTNFFKDPCALALKEATGGDYAMVGWGYGRTGHGNMLKNWTLFPFPVLRDFLSAWDQGKPVEPIGFFASLDRETSKVGAPKRKPTRHKPFVDDQRELGLK